MRLISIFLLALCLSACTSSKKSPPHRANVEALDTMWLRVQHHPSGEIVPILIAGKSSQTQVIDGILWEAMSGPDPQNEVILKAAGDSMLYRIDEERNLWRNKGRADNYLNKVD